MISLQLNITLSITSYYPRFGTHRDLFYKQQKIIISLIFLFASLFGYTQKHFSTANIYTWLDDVTGTAGLPIHYGKVVRSENEFFVAPNELPLIVVDGVPVPALNEFLDFNVRDIDKINVAKGDYYMGAKKYHGIVSFKTKTSDFHSNLNNKNTLVWEIPAPLPKKVYHMQQYPATSQEGINHLPDFRSQLLWNPNLYINQGEHPLHFYTSDTTGVFEITLSGFSTDGKPVHLKAEFLVE